MTPGRLSRQRTSAEGARSGLFFERYSLNWVFLIQYVGELGGVEDFAAELTFDELGVFLAGNDADLGVFAEGGHGRFSEYRVCLCPKGKSMAESHVLGN